MAGGLLRYSDIRFAGAAMNEGKKRAVLPRKTPRQSRARDTVEVILAAATRILEREGGARLTTNAVAERAGISVGSLYEYFPSKQAILVALARRLMEDDRQRVRAAMSGAPYASLEALARKAVRALIDLHAEQPRLRRAVLEVYFAFGFREEQAQMVGALVEELRAASANIAQLKELSSASWFVLTRATLGVLRAALWEESSLLDDATALEDELVRLLLGYLASPFAGRA